MSKNNTEMTSKFIVQRKVQFVLTTNESRRVYRDTTTEQFLAAVSHSMGAATATRMKRMRRHQRQRQSRHKR